MASFPCFNGTDSVHRWNNEARAHIAVWTHVSLFHRFTDINVYETSSVKIWKTRHKNISGHTDIFYTVLYSQDGQQNTEKR